MCGGPQIQDISSLIIIVVLRFFPLFTKFDSMIKTNDTKNEEKPNCCWNFIYHVHGKNEKRTEYAIMR